MVNRRGAGAAGVKRQAEDGEILAERGDVRARAGVGRGEVDVIRRIRGKESVGRAGRSVRPVRGGRTRTRAAVPATIDQASPVDRAGRTGGDGQRDRGRGLRQRVIITRRERVAIEIKTTEAGNHTAPGGRDERVSAGTEARERRNVDLRAGGTNGKIARGAREVEGVGRGGRAELEAEVRERVRAAKSRREAGRHIKGGADAIGIEIETGSDG